MHFISYSTSQFGRTAFVLVVISHMWLVVTLTGQCNCRASGAVYLDCGILRWTVLLLQQERQKSNTGEIRACVWCGEGVQIQLLRESVESLIHWVLQNWVQIHKLPLTGWESLGKSLYLRPNFLLWKLVLTLGKSCRLNEIIHVKHLTQYMAYFTYLIMTDIIIIPLRQN